MCGFSNKARASRRVLGNLGLKITDNLVEVSSDGNGENPEGCVSVKELRTPSSRGAKGGDIAH